MSSEFRIEVLATGDELLDGRVADTNTLRLADALASWGLEIAERVTVRDDIEAIVREARAAVARGTKLCVVSGGLGTTSDDVTREAFAQLAGVALVRDAAVAAHIAERAARRGFPVLESLARQADRPQGATLLENPVGSAPGFAITFAGCCFVSLPGVPREFEAMIAEGVVTRLIKPEQPLLKRLFKCFGMGESAVDERLASLARVTPAVRVGYRAAFPEVHVSLVADAGEVASLDRAAAFVRSTLGDIVFTETAGASLAKVVLEMLRVRSATLSVAESCTGGLLGDTLTDVAGSSDVFVGGVIAYANAVKLEALGVASETLATYGAVSEQVVAAMAEGARRRLGSTYALAVSGVAGPNGGTPDKPVGTVWLALAGPSGVKTRQLSLSFDRRYNKVVSVAHALDLLRRELLV